MRITRLRIENFRSIKFLEMELGETTVLIGQNNAGKTAILDAVRIALIVTALSDLRYPENENLDLSEDVAAWRELTNGISRHLGRDAPLDQFLQELQLRSKEPTPKPGTVALMTVHGAKGREFDYVYVVGMAEDVMPSFQSRKKGDASPEMEEERRNCFVAITRTKECLVLSRASTYRGWGKQPSRFLVEMGLVAEQAQN